MSKKKRIKKTNNTLFNCDELAPSFFSTSLPIAYVIDDVKNTSVLQSRIAETLLESNKAMEFIPPKLPISGNLCKVRFNEQLFPDVDVSIVFKIAFVREIINRYGVNTRAFWGEGVILLSSDMSSNEFLVAIDNTYNDIYEFFARHATGSDKTG